MITTTPQQRARQRISYTGMNGYVPRSRRVHAVVLRRAGRGVVAGKMCRPWDHRYLDTMQPTEQPVTCPGCICAIAAAQMPASWTQGPLPERNTERQLALF